MNCQVFPNSSFFNKYDMNLKKVDVPGDKLTFIRVKSNYEKKYIQFIKFITRRR